jgi:hypothetical protein
MAYAWIENGPVSLPPRKVAYWAGAVVAILALIGIAIGFRAAWREAPVPGSGADTSLGLPGDDTLTARPIVVLPPPVVAPTPDQALAKADDAAAADKAAAIAKQTAAAQAVQAKPSKPPGNIDDILTSASERPPARARPGPADEAPPSAPVKSDVPF